MHLGCVSNAWISFVLNSRTKHVRIERKNITSWKCVICLHCLRLKSIMIDMGAFRSIPILCGIQGKSFECCSVEAVFFLHCSKKRRGGIVVLLSFYVLNTSFLTHSHWEVSTFFSFGCGSIKIGLILYKYITACEGNIQHFQLKKCEKIVEMA